MICSQVQRKLAVYLRGAMEIAERRALECHLSGCEECAGYLFQCTYVNGGRVQIRDGEAPSESLGRSMRA